jgi:outer membrane protein
MRKVITSSLLLATLYSASASADFLGLYVGGGSWNHDPSGDFSSTDAGSTNIDVASTLGLSDESETYFWAAFEHPVPVLPNVRVERTALGHSGSGSTSVTFDGQNFTSNYASNVVLDSTDIVLYYRLLDNWVNLDLGLNVRSIDGEFSIKDGANDRIVDVSETVPMLYAAAQFDLPFTGFSVGADYSVISYDGSSYSDMRVRGIYETGPLGFELGLRTTSLELDDVDGINANVDFDGLMMGVFLHF